MNAAKSIDALYDAKKTGIRGYADCEEDEEILLPITRAGYDELFQVVIDKYDLPKDDELMGSLIRFVHHLPLEQNTTTIETVGKVLHKFCSNHVSWRIDQEIKTKRLAEIEELKAQAEKEKAAHLTIVEDEVPSPKEDAH